MTMLSGVIDQGLGAAYAGQLVTWDKPVIILLHGRVTLINRPPLHSAIGSTSLMSLIKCHSGAVAHRLVAISLVGKKSVN